MRAISLSSTETYDDLVLFIESNNFGDQILSLRKEYLDGRQEVVWTNVEQENSHRQLTKKFLNNLAKEYK